MENEQNRGVSRRRAIAAGTALIGWAAVLPGQAAAPARKIAPGAGDIVVTLIGTGSVVPNDVRYGNCTLIQAGGVSLLIDAGRGCAVRLTQLGVAMGKIDAFFLTHLHSDHVIGLPDLWMTGYLKPDFGLRQGPMLVNGPVGTVHLANTMHDAFSEDVRIRMADEKLKEEATQVIGKEFSEDGVIFSRNGVTVTGFAVDHGPLIKPSAGYRVDFNGLAVLVSGDTRFSENLIKHGAGCDVIVHEVAVAAEKMEERDQLVMNHHTSPEEVGTVFARTKPRLGVFSHIVDLLNDQRDAVGVREIERRARKTWTGKMMVGDDLTRIIVSKAAVDVQKFNHAKGGYG